VTNLARSIGGNWLLNLLQLAAVLVLSPYVLDQLGADLNGAWVAIVSWTGILSLLVLGVPMTAVRFAGAEAARGDEAAFQRVISTVQQVLVGLAGAALVTGTGLWLWFGERWLTSPEAQVLSEVQRSDARLAFALIVVQVSFAFVLRLPYGILEARRDFLARNALMAGEVLLRTGLTLACLAWRPELSTLAGVLVATLACEALVTRAVLRKRHPQVRLGFSGADRSLWRPLLNYSVFVLLLNVGALIAFRVDAIVISTHLPPSEATWFDFGNKFFDPLAGLLIAVGAVVMPYAAHLATQSSSTELQAVFLRWSKVCTLVSLLVLVYLITVGQAFLTVWAGPEVGQRSSEVLQVLCFGFLLYLPVRGVAVPVLMGSGSPKIPAIAMVITGALNLGLSWWLVQTHGIVGVAWGTAIPNTLFAAWVLPEACRRSGTTTAVYVRHVLAPQWLAAGAIGTLLWFTVQHLQPSTWWEVVGLGVMEVLLFAIVWLGLVWRGDAHLDTRTWWSKLRP
jgi:O-antigen/teichoic acid export membrane protein